METNGKITVLYRNPENVTGGLSQITSNRLNKLNCFFPQI